MSLGAFVGRIARTIIPQASVWWPTGVATGALTGGHHIDHSPALDAAGPATGPGTAWTWSPMIALLATALTDLWVEGVVVTEASVINAEYHIGITMATGAGVLNPLLAEAIVPYGSNAAADLCQFIKIDPPVFIPVGQRIAFAVAGDTAAKSATINCWAIHSENK